MSAAPSLAHEPATIDLSLPLSNLARFALMRSTRPVGINLSTQTDPDGVIRHLRACRDWALSHDHSRCYCADSGACPACTLARCDACDGAITDETQTCIGCIAASNHSLREADDVARSMMNPRRNLHRRGGW